jgi:hypothetical protein
MIRSLVLTLLFASSIAQAEIGEKYAKPKYRLLEAIQPVLALDNMNIKVMKFGCNREFQIPEIDCKDWTGRVSSEFDLILFNKGFWRNELHGEAALGKFYSIGWHWELGVRLGAQIELMWEHHSRHTMDIEQPWYVDRRTLEVIQYRFPVEDSIGIRFKIYERNPNQR